MRFFICAEPAESKETMKDVIELRQKKARLLDEAEAILDQENRTKADMNRAMALTQEAKEMQTEIEMRDEIGESRTVIPCTIPASIGDDYKGEQRVITGKGRLYRDMFPGPVSNGGFESREEFFAVVASERFDPRLKGAEERALTEGIPSAGGFSVPTEYAAWLMDNSLEAEIVRPRAQIWPMTTKTRKIPGFDGSDHTSSLFGGFSGVWLDEVDTSVRQYPKLRQLELNAKKIGIYTQASRELLEDGMSFEEQLGSAMIKAIGFYMDDAFLNGTGSGQPLGVLNDPALLVVTKESGQLANTILYANCTKMFARLHPACLSNAIWIANSTAIPQLLSMSIAVGTGGSFIPAVVQSSGRHSLLGLPLVFTEKVPALTNQGDLTLVDFSQYAVGLRRELSLDKSNAPGWTEDCEDFRVIARVDGQGTWSSAITPAHGDSLSWVVTLGAR